MKYLIITKDKDYIATAAECKKVAKTLGAHCQIYDKNGTLVHPAGFYDGEDRIWAKDFIRKHKVGDSTKDAQEEYFINHKNSLNSSIK